RLPNFVWTTAWTMAMPPRPSSPSTRHAPIRVPGVIDASGRLRRGRATGMGGGSHAVGSARFVAVIAWAMVDLLLCTKRTARCRAKAQEVHATTALLRPAVTSQHVRQVARCSDRHLNFALTSVLALTGKSVH